MEEGGAGLRDWLVGDRGELFTDEDHAKQSLPEASMAKLIYQAIQHGLGH